MTEDKTTHPEAAQPETETRGVKHAAQIPWADLANASPRLLTAFIILYGLIFYHVSIGQLMGRVTQLGLGPFSISANSVEQKLTNLSEDKNNPAVTYLTQDQANYLTKRFNEAVAEKAYVNILWVDDMPQNNKQLVDIFETLGFHVYFATSYTEAETLFNERAFSVVISDYNEPNDPDQIQALSSGNKNWGVGALVANYIGQSCGDRTIIFSAGWKPEMGTPPYAYLETNNYFELLDATADLIEKPIHPNCF